MGRNVLHAGTFTCSGNNGYLEYFISSSNKRGIYIQISEATVRSLYEYYAIHCPLSAYARHFRNSGLCVASFYFSDRIIFSRMHRRRKEEEEDEDEIRSDLFL
jgi:hypothetical protein